MLNLSTLLKYQSICQLLLNLITEESYQESRKLGTIVLSRKVKVINYAVCTLIVVIILNLSTLLKYQSIIIESDYGIKLSRIKKVWYISFIKKSKNY